MLRTKSNNSIINKQEELHKIRRYSQNGFFLVDKVIVSKFGWIGAGVLSNLLDKYEYWLCKENQNIDGWFFHTMQHQACILGLSEYQIREQKKILIENGIIQVKLRGIPPKEFYKINLEVLDLILKKHLRDNPLIFRGITLKKLEGLPSNNLRDIKDTKSKDTKSKEEKINKKDFFLNKFPLDWKENKSFQEALFDFAEHRLQKNSSGLTEPAMKLAAKKLLKFPIQTAITTLNDSTAAGYTGLFPKSVAKGGNGKSKFEFTEESYSNQENATSYPKGHEI